VQQRALADKGQRLYYQPRDGISINQGERGRGKGGGKGKNNEGKFSESDRKWNQPGQAAATTTHNTGPRPSKGRGGDTLDARSSLFISFLFRHKAFLAALNDSIGDGMRVLVQESRIDWKDTIRIPKEGKGRSSLFGFLRFGDDNRLQLQQGRPFLVTLWLCSLTRGAIVGMGMGTTVSGILWFVKRLLLVLCWCLGHVII
jgi:hypothetical protein